ncbi:MAG: response regulator [Verrucomicrobia bacterium]|nr:response regulator [Verrucomicrobiota bacterium]
MPARHKLLILDDEQDILDLFREFLTRLPGEPEIHTAINGARALALLESEPFSLLLTDLKMPNIDGFQVLTIARKKYPGLKTVVISGLGDEQTRSRAYSLGIDLFLEKPKSNKEINLFVDCIEALLNREEVGGFRGIQSKGISDIVQMECLSKNSTVLKIINGPMEGKIWIHDGDIMDAAVGELTGEAAFKKIFGWKSGHFENLPGDPARPRTIHNSYQGLLLDSAQSADESEGGEAPPAEAGAPAAPPATPLAAIARIKGVEFVVSMDTADAKKFDHWGAENPEKAAAWCQKTMQGFRALGEQLKAGPLNQLIAMGSQNNAAMISNASATKDLCVGFHRSLTTT